MRRGHRRETRPGPTALLLAASLVGTLLAAAPSAACPTNGLLGYWPINGDATDESGCGNDGTLNGPVLTIDRDGNPDSAYDFDGVDDQIVMGPDSDLQPALPLSFAMWVRNDCALATECDLVWASPTGGVYTGVRIYIQTTGVLAVQYGDGGAASSVHRRSAFGSTPLPSGWHHVAVVIRGPTDFEIYIDGVADSLTYSGSGGTLSYVNTPLYVGWASDKFTGVIDELRLYDRQLSFGEISDLVGDLPSKLALEFSGGRIQNPFESAGMPYPTLTFSGPNVVGVAPSNFLATLNAGTDFAGTRSTPVSDPTWASALVGMISSNLAGTFNGTSINPWGLHGPAAFGGTLQLLTGSGPVLNVPIHLGGPTNTFVSTFWSGLGRVTVNQAPWTAGRATIPGVPTTQTTVIPPYGTFTQMGTTTLTARGTNRLDANGVGILQLVAPMRVSVTGFGGLHVIPVFGRLTLRYVPEPGQLLLLGSGAAFLALAGRRRLRRQDESVSGSAPR